MPALAEIAPWLAIAAAPLYPALRPEAEGLAGFEAVEVDRG